MLFLVFCLLFTGCPSPLTVEPETIPDETHDNTPEEAPVITSSAKNISLTAQDDGILITLTKEDDFPYTSVYIEDAETHININYNIDYLPWSGNKAEILYPFSESGKVSRFNLQLSGNGNSERQTVEITATRGIGYPMTSFFEEIQLTPSYKATDDSFWVTVTTAAETISDFFSDSVKTDNRFTNGTLSVQFWLGTPNRKYGIDGCSISANNSVSGSYKTNFSSSTYHNPPDYADYDNKFYTQALFWLHFNGIRFLGYAKSTSEICAITNAPKKYISAKCQNNGVLFIVTKEDDWNPSELSIKDETNGILICCDKLNWVNNQAEILYPFTEQNKYVQFTYYGPDNFSKAVQVIAYGGIGKPVKDFSDKVSLKPSYNKNTNTFTVNVDTTGLSISDIIKDNVSYQTSSVQCDKLNVYAGYPESNNNNQLIGSYDLNSSSLNAVLDTYSIPKSVEIDFPVYNNIFFAEMLFGVNLDEFYFELPCRSERCEFLFSEAKNISLEAVSGGILIKLKKGSDWTRDYLSVFIHEISDEAKDSISKSEFDSLWENVVMTGKTGYFPDENFWSDSGTAEILYPLSEAGKTYIVFTKYNTNDGQKAEIVSITATGGYGNPKKEIVDEINFEPVYDSTTGSFFVNFDTTEDKFSSLIGNQRIADMDIRMVYIKIYLISETGYTYGSCNLNLNSIEPGLYEIIKNGNTHDFEYETRFYAEMELCFKLFDCYEGTGYWIKSKKTNSIPMQ